MKKLLIFAMLLIPMIARAQSPFISRVTADSNDCTVDRGNDSYYITYSNWIGAFNHTYDFGLRWTAATALAGATIDSAFIVFQCFTSNMSNQTGDSMHVTFAIDTVANSPNFGYNGAGQNWLAHTWFYNSPNRKWIGAVEWGSAAIGHWSTDVHYRSPDIKTLIQPVVNLANYSGIITIKGESVPGSQPTGQSAGREYWDYAHNSANACSLVVYYTSGVTPPTALSACSIDSISADSGRFIYTTPNQAVNDSVKIRAVNGSACGDSSTITLSRVWKNNATDTIRFAWTLTARDTIYVSGWSWDATNGYSPRCCASKILYEGTDTYAPDNHKAFSVNRVVSLDPDTVELIIGAAPDSADYTATRIRFGTSVLTNYNSGSSLWSGSTLSNSTVKYAFMVSNGNWVHFKIFAGDEVPNWSSGIADSVYWPANGNSCPPCVGGIKYIQGP